MDSITKHMGCHKGALYLVDLQRRIEIGIVEVVNLLLQRLTSEYLPWSQRLVGVDEFPSVPLWPKVSRDSSVGLATGIAFDVSISSLKIVEEELNLSRFLLYYSTSVY